MPGLKQTCLLGFPLPVIIIENARACGKGEHQADVGHWLHTMCSQCMLHSFKGEILYVQQVLGARAHERRCLVSPLADSWLGLSLLAQPYTCRLAETGSLAASRVHYVCACIVSCMASRAHHTSEGIAASLRCIPACAHAAAACPGCSLHQTLHKHLLLLHGSRCMVACVSMQFTSILDIPWAVRTIFAPEKKAL